MIKYLNTKDEIIEVSYDKESMTIDLSHKNITQILEMKGFTNLRNLGLFGNQITEIKGLDKLVNLKSLHLGLNQIEEIKGLDKLINLNTLNLNSNRITEIKGLDKLINLNTLNLNSNRITEIKGLDKLINLSSLILGENQIEEIKGLDKLINLSSLYLSKNKITEIKELDNLVNLTELYFRSNKIKEITGLENLINLTSLTLDYNKIKEIKGLDNLVNLINLELINNEITEIEGFNNLISMKNLQLDFNKITKIKGLNNLNRLNMLSLCENPIEEIPLSIMNSRELCRLYVECEISPIIQRFLYRNRIKEGKTIYDDAQNVHDGNIVKSIKDSIYTLMSNNDYRMKDIECVLKDVISDNILDQTTKEQIIDYCQDKTLHSVLNLTFDEVFCCVWNVISEHKESSEIKKILNIEMKDSLCKCFTGRLSRLVNCLNGFDSRVSIKISDKEQILNVIIKIRNKYNDVDKQKDEIYKELIELGYDKETINEYLIYLE
jgi:Leucine-rich repeat (LRR) protein